MKYLANGIFFTVAQDEDSIYGSDEYAMKVTKREIRQVPKKALTTIYRRPAIIL